MAMRGRGHEVAGALGGGVTVAGDVASWCGAAWGGGRRPDPASAARLQAKKNPGAVAGVWG